MMETDHFLLSGENSSLLQEMIVNTHISVEEGEAMGIINRIISICLHDHIVRKRMVTSLI